MNQDPPKPKPSLSEFSGILYRLDSTGGLLTGLKASIGTSITQNDYDSIVLHFNTLADSVEAAVPSGRCPYCHARGEGCSFCGNIGWVSKIKMNLAAREVVDLAEFLHGVEEIK